MSEQEWHASNVTLGAFTLPPSLVNQVNRNDAVKVDDSMLAKVSASMRGPRLRTSEGGFYLGANPGDPQVGDVKITFRVVKPAEVSVVAQQTGSTLRPYQAKAGGTIELLDMGNVSAAQMFQSAQDANTLMTWILRLIGYLFMAFGLSMVFKPISVIGDVVPFIGSMLSFGTGVFSFAVSLTLTIITIAVGWIFYRPVLGILLLLLGVGAMVGFKMMMKGKKSPRAAGGYT